MQILISGIKKLKSFFKKRPRSVTDLERLIDTAYVAGASNERAANLAIIDKAIEVCSSIECWSEAARRARSQIVARNS